MTMVAAEPMISNSLKREREREVCVSQWASNLFQKVLLLDWWLCIWRSSPINHFDFSICVWHFKWFIFKPMVEHCDFLTFHFFAHDLSMSRWTASSAGEKIHSRWQPKTFVLAFASIFGSEENDRKHNENPWSTRLIRMVQARIEWVLLEIFSGVASE